ncbi:MAG: type II secretion system GspH family protein [Synergistaceae bacterium]|jgi:prepilin-type N-terminal cleavage/methylation domain-containing protein|nr:type II secretion system GspH family protein [Synergistaceae bacterium]
MFLFMNDNSRDRIRKRAPGGFTLVEVLIVIMIIATLAGTLMLAISYSSDNAEAAAVMSDLDAAKNALLAYSMEHRTRMSDRLDEFENANSFFIVDRLNKYLSSQITMSGSKTKARFDKIDVDIAPDGKIRIGFVGFPATSGLVKALERKTAGGNSSAVYDVSGSGTNCTIWLDVK